MITKFLQQGLAAGFTLKSQVPAPGTNERRTFSNVGAGPYQLLADDDSKIIGSTGNVTLVASLSGIAGRVYIIKNLNPSVTSITLSRGSNGIDGATSDLVLAPLESVYITNDGSTQWWTLANR